MIPLDLFRTSVFTLYFVHASIMPDYHASLLKDSYIFRKCLKLLEEEVKGLSSAAKNGLAFAFLMKNTDLFANKTAEETALHFFSQ